MGQGAFLMMRLENVRAEFSLTALAYNLRRVINIVGIGAMIAAVEGWASASPAQHSFGCAQRRVELVRLKPQQPQFDPRLRYPAASARAQTEFPHGLLDLRTRIMPQWYTEACGIGTQSGKFVPMLRLFELYEEGGRCRSFERQWR
jgi:hypothetical protein